MIPQQQALDFLKGLKNDIMEAKTGSIEIESTDLEQIEHCIELIGQPDQFEYEYFYFYNVYSQEQMKEPLNKLGKSGWQVVDVKLEQFRLTGLFKRKIKGSKCHVC